MRFLADENFPGPAVVKLRETGHDVVWMSEVAPGAADSDILDIAERDRRVILTFDKDFGELARRRPVTAGVVLLRVGLKPPMEASTYLAGLICARSDWAGHFAVIDTNKVRLRPLPL